MATKEQINEATEVVAYYTLAASATGAVPVPAASAAIIAEDAAMIAHVGSVMGVEVSVITVVEALGIMGSINVLGRNLFIEGAKLLSWGTGSVWAFAGLCAFGASTAGLQTYIVGRLAIEIAKNGGLALSGCVADRVIADAKSTYDDFVSHWQTNKPEIAPPNSQGS